jgi:ubiquitin-conjugating enzyme E2 variant
VRVARASRGVFIVIGDLFGFVFGGTTRYPNRYRGIESFAILAFAVMAVLLGLSIARGLRIPGALWWLVPLAMAAYLAADFVSGLVHWLADTFGTEETPFFGPKFVKNFRNHHTDPKGITRHDFVETNGDNCLVSLPVMGTTYWLVPIEDELWGACVGMFILAMMLFVLLTNQLHKWAHMDEPPAFIRPLQRTFLVLAPSHHAVHHASPHDRNYCITSGWLNPILDGIGFFKAMEKLVVTTTRWAAMPVEVQRKDPSPVDAG